ncbi:hypothetical protein ACVILK_005563 [Bradyrhizobium embrapense]
MLAEQAGGDRLSPQTSSLVADPHPDLPPFRGKEKTEILKRNLLRAYYAASMRRKPFHTAVAAPDVSTGKSRASW